MNNKILIVDDSNFARKVMRGTLEKRSYNNLCEAANAEEAFQMFVKENPELTFLDISLPDCQDLSLLKKMIEYRPDAKIVMCSALRQSVIISDAIKMGAKEYIQKPYEKKTLLEIVDKVLMNS